jgi:hypothetical protein
MGRTENRKFKIRMKEHLHFTESMTGVKETGLLRTSNEYESKDTKTN